MDERDVASKGCTRAKDWLYVLFPLRYYHRKHLLGDGHGYAQLTRFIPPSVAKFFDHGSVVADQSEEEIVSRGTTARDIRKTIRSIWD